MEQSYSIVEEFIDACNIDRSLRLPLEQYVDISWGLYGNISILGTNVKKELSKHICPKDLSMIESVLRSKGIKKTTEHVDDTDITECISEIIGTIDIEDFETDKEIITKGIGAIEKKKSIKSLLEPLEIEETVKTLAEECFSTINIKLRIGTKSKLVLFYCIHKAYERLGTPRDPKIIAGIVGINSKSISRAFNFCEPKDSKASTVTCISPIDLIPDYCKKIGLEEHQVEEIKAFSRTIMEHGQELYDEFPQTIAAGLIFVFLLHKGEQVTRRDMSLMLGKSDATIGRAQQKIMIPYQKAMNDPIDSLFLF